MNKEEIEKVKELLNKCDNCKLKECIACEFTWTDIQKIKKYVEELETMLDKVTDKLKEDAREEKGYIKWLDERTQEISQPRKTIIIKSDYARSILNIIESRKEIN